MSVDASSIGGLQATDLLPPSGPDPKDIRPKNHEEAAREFEAYMAQMLVKEMRKTLSDDGIFSSTGVQMFSEVFDQEVAERIAESGRLGLQDSILRGLAGRDVTPPPEAPVGVAPDAARRFSVRMPVEGGVVTSRFGLRKDPFHGGRRNHKGIDISAPRGATIRPVKAGTVVSAGQRSGYGKVVVVDHGDGLQTLYAHCDRLFVRPGDPVSPSTPIAAVGDTGRATGPHLHLEARVDGDAVDPVEAFGWRR
jgi:murein DD-endopeptidase MepM/ murein hydrolase activator NlpD